MTDALRSFAAVTVPLRSFDVVTAPLAIDFAVTAPGAMSPLRTMILLGAAFAVPTTAITIAISPRTVPPLGRQALSFPCRPPLPFAVRDPWGVVCLL